MSELEINNITEASEVIASLAPVYCTLGGQELELRKPRWMDYKSLFKRAWGPIRKAIAAYNAYSDAERTKAIFYGSLATLTQPDAEGQETQASPQEIQELAVAQTAYESAAKLLKERIDEAMQEIQEAPEVVETILCACLRCQPNKLEEYDGEDVLIAFGKALRTHFIENRRLLDFFGDTTRAVLGQTETAEA